MSNRSRGVMMSSLTFLGGLLVGVGAGMFLAPQSGARTRRQLRALLEDVGERASCMAIDARETLNRIVEHGRRLVA